MVASMLPETPIPAQRNAALPGAVLMLAGAFLIYWALNDWGVFGGKAPDVASADF